MTTSRRPRRSSFATVSAGLVLILLLAAGLAGCRSGRPAAPSGVSSSGAAEPAAGGTSVHTLVVDGRERTYRLYRPARVGAPAPLVVFLHGGLGSGQQAEESYGWDALADRAGFVVVYPDGLGRAWNVGGGCCGASGRTGVDDVGFVSAVVAAVRATVPVDGRRVYATGISNGGMLSHRLACDTTLFAAIGPDSATLLGSCPHPAPVSVISVHGTADRSVRYDGAPGSGVAVIDGPAVPELDAAWRAVDSCAAPTVRREGVVTTSVATCPGGREVRLVTVDGAGHQWPGAAPRPAVQRALGLDAPSTALDATTTIWAFFAAHPAPAAPAVSAT